MATNGDMVVCRLIELATYFWSYDGCMLAMDVDGQTRAPMAYSVLDKKSPQFLKTFRIREFQTVVYWGSQMQINV